MSQAIQYALNGDKTEHRILTAHQNCDSGREYQQMMDTKREVGKLDGRQCYHIIQSFKPGESTPELALKIAKEFAAEYAKEQEELAAEIAELEKAIASYDQGKKSAKKFIALIDKYQGFESMTNTMPNEFVEKILVHGMEYTRKIIPPAASAEIDAMAELSGEDIAELVRITTLFSNQMLKKFNEIKECL